MMELVAIIQNGLKINKIDHIDIKMSRNTFNRICPENTDICRICQAILSYMKEHNHIYHHHEIKEFFEKYNNTNAKILIFDKPVKN